MRTKRDGIEEMTWTPYQQRLIASLKGGAVLHYIGGMNGHWFTTDRIKPAPTHRTVDKLQAAGVIRVIHSDWRGSTWVYKP